MCKTVKLVKRKFDNYKSFPFHFKIATYLLYIDGGNLLNKNKLRKNTYNT